MSEENMPAADVAHYELAFHVLPTVAEGEVADVFASLKASIEAAGGTLTTEESPKRFDLAYEIVKYLEGRNRKFTSAYFGWIRFTMEPAKVEEVNEALEGVNQLLRHLLIRLTKAEEENTFMFHEALEESQVAVEVDEEVKEKVDAEGGEGVLEQEEKKEEVTEEKSSKEKVSA
jgi:ribosomal protein S6